MTLLAPEPRPVSPLAAEPTRTSGPAAGPAGQDTPTATLRVWWDGLPRGRRAQLLDLSPDEVLPRSLAAELQRLGVDCPLTLVAEDLRQVRRALPPAGLLALLERERAR